MYVCLTPPSGSYPGQCHGLLIGQYQMFCECTMIIDRPVMKVQRDKFVVKCYCLQKCT